MSDPSTNIIVAVGAIVLLAAGGLISIGIGIGWIIWG